jgi:hypothetical protein
MTTTKTSKTTQQALLDIAKKHSWEIDNRGDLETRMSDADDFIEVSVWGFEGHARSRLQTRNRNQVAMNAYEQDRAAIKAGNSVEVMKRRKAEMIELEKELAATKNSFRASIIAHDLRQRRAEYACLDNLI